MKNYLLLAIALSCGAVLAYVQPVEQQSSVDDKKARLAEARAKLSLATQMYDIAKTNADTPKEKLEQLKAAVDAAEQLVDDSK
jgi:multidrug efflux pump subunit AcrA (membrane-fusion protein)